MRYSKAIVVDGRLVETEIKEIEQQSLTSDCWLIQFDGLSACESCDCRNTEDCGGGEMLAKMREVVE
jgi:hypothetical protein